MANSVNPDQTAENFKKFRHWSDSREWQTVETLIRLMKMTNSVDPDQTVPENWTLTLIRLLVKSVDPDQTAGHDSVDLDQTADNGKWCRP